jgi:hypothetical protein
VLKKEAGKIEEGQKAAISKKGMARKRRIGRDNILEGIGQQVGL